MQRIILLIVLVIAVLFVFSCGVLKPIRPIANNGTAPIDSKSATKPPVTASPKVASVPEAKAKTATNTPTIAPIKKPVAITAPAATAKPTGTAERVAPAKAVAPVKTVAPAKAVAPVKVVTQETKPVSAVAASTPLAKKPVETPERWHNPHSITFSGGYTDISSYTGDRLIIKSSSLGKVGSLNLNGGYTFDLAYAYRFSKHFAIEPFASYAGYNTNKRYLGKKYSVDLSTISIGANFVVIFPVDRIDLYGFTGAAYILNKLKYSSPDARTDNGENIGIQGGLGADYFVLDDKLRLGLRYQYQLNKQNMSEDVVDLSSHSLAFRLGWLF